MTRHVPFRQVDVRRALKAVQSAGLQVSAVEIAPDGTIRVLTGQKAEEQLSPLERWRRSRGRASGMSAEEALRTAIAIAEDSKAGRRRRRPK